MKLFDLSLKYAGFPIKKAQKVFDEILGVPENEYEAFINQKKAEIVEFHLKNNSFYRNLCRNKNVDDWNDLPILTKADLQQPLSQRLSDGFPAKKVFVNKTSGSSGTPFIFAKDKFSHALTWASTIHLFGEHSINFNDSYQARFYGIPKDFVGYQKERLKDTLSKRYRFPIFDLSDIELEKILIKFKKDKFDYINGYTSSIVLFAKFLQSRKLILKEICPSLKGCFVTSEMLFEKDKLLMENQFRIPIINEYGASELGIISFQNPKGDWHINSETLFVEILDENNQPVCYGTEGKVVVTSLYNKAHPFIRYEIGDTGTLEERSTSKNPILKKLIGRTNDIAILPSGKKSPGLTFYYVTKSIIEDNGTVKEFVVKQHKIDTFEIEYVSSKALEENQIQEIKGAIALYLEPNLIVNFSKKDFLKRTKSGKLKQFVSLLN
jgi:phenylacetate-CoA ligase